MTLYHGSVHRNTPWASKHYSTVDSLDLIGTGRWKSEEVRHASLNADSACPFLYWCNGKKGHAESAFRDACRTSSGWKRMVCVVVKWDTYKNHNNYASNGAFQVKRNQLYCFKQLRHPLALHMQWTEVNVFKQTPSSLARSPIILMMSSR